jgi:hypothetical protein
MKTLFSTGFRRTCLHPVKFPLRSAAILAFLTWSGSALYGQESFHYQFSLQGVTDPAAAKEVTDIVRPVFNTDTDPFVTFPWFTDEKDQFDFTCSLAVTREELESALLAQGIVLMDFTTTKVESKTEER